MSNVWGENLTLSIFGESHGTAIGIVIGGLPAGVAFDWAAVQREMKRRAPGGGELATSRREEDEPEIVSGILNGRTNGAPLCVMIRNADIQSGAYNKDLPRPGHADLAAFLKYQGYNDYRGGGHFSGRLTAPLVFAGVLAKQLLAGQGVVIGAHIRQIGTIYEQKFAASIDKEALLNLKQSAFPLLDESLYQPMRQAILDAKAHGDSVGGCIECAAVGLPAGLGEPFFHSLESSIASMLFAIPAVKGVEFGDGFAMAAMKGSEANDQIFNDKGVIKTVTNHNGGINGGISNGMPLVVSVAVKPTPSIAMEQRTVNLATGAEAVLTVKGRHDPCIVPRAVVVVEAALALCLWDKMAARINI